MSHSPPLYHDETAGTFGLYRWEFAGPVSGPGAHFHRTITESLAKMLLHFAPGAPREAYFEQLAAGIADFDEDAYDRFMREHDNTWV